MGSVEGPIMKVCFFIWGLRAAGAERVLTLLANTWAGKGWEVVVLTMEPPGQAPFYPLAPSVMVRPLDLIRDSAGPISGLFNNVRRVRTIRRAIAETAPEVVISFIDGGNILSILATRGLGIPVVISERTDPSRRSLGRVWGLLRDLTYPLASVAVFQSRAVLAWFPPRVGSKGRVIPNPVPPPPPAAPATENREARRVVALGRLHPVKGFDLLLPAFKMALAEVPGWTLDIWGEGPEREALDRLAGDLGLREAVRFRGLTEDAYQVLRGSDLYVLSSRVEGFPNALVEAMACGLPVISTDFGGAARDIVQDGVNGLLVPAEDPGAMAAAMVRLMRDGGERQRLGGRATEVVQRYSTDRVVGLWEEAVAAARSGKNS